MSRHGCFGALCAALLAGSQLGGGLGLGPVMALAASSTVGPSGHPNRSTPAAPARVNHLPSPPPASGPKPVYSRPRTTSVPMQPGLVALDPAAAAHFLGSDGVLELTVPAG